VATSTVRSVSSANLARRAFLLVDGFGIEQIEEIKLATSEAENESARVPDVSINRPMSRRGCVYREHHNPVYLEAG
jgi:hypothetical protein